MYAKQAFVLAAEAGSSPSVAGSGDGGGLFSKLAPAELFSTVVYSLLGFVLFIIAFVLMEKLTPFSIRKEIEEDQNVALAVIMAGITIGMAIIVSAAIR